MEPDSELMEANTKINTLEFELDWYIAEVKRFEHHWKITVEALDAQRVENKRLRKALNENQIAFNQFKRDKEGDLKEFEIEPDLKLLSF